MRRLAAAALTGALALAGIGALGAGGPSVAAPPTAPSTASSAAPSTGDPDARAVERFTTRVFATVPRPGFPAYAFAHRNGRVYAGTYTNPTGDTQRSKVFEWSRSGALLRSWRVPGQDLSQDHGVQVATNDAAGRLVLLEKSTRRIMRLNVTNGRFTTYSRLPAGSIPNYAAWAPSGALYVSDYAKGTIWKVPPGGGRARAWFSDPRLTGAAEFGTTGLVLALTQRSPDQGTIVFGPLP